MEYDKINNLLRSEDSENENLSKFVTRQYVKVKKGKKYHLSKFSILYFL